MSFLDNLENSLKSLESQDERAAERGLQKEKREAERAQALAIAPWAEQLKTGPFVPKLLDEAARAGHARRIKVHIVWIGTTLRLEARERRLELRPTADGVAAAFIEGGVELREHALDLGSDPAELVRSWLG